MPDAARHQRVKFIKLCLNTTSVDCRSLYPELGVSSEFFTVLQACQLFLHGKSDKADRLCRGVVNELKEKEREDCNYELTSVVQAYIQESIQWTNQNKKILLFDSLPPEVGNSTKGHT